MAKKETCEKVCWWTKTGDLLDVILPFSPNKNKKTRD